MPTDLAPYPDRLKAARRYAETRVIRAQLVETIAGIVAEHDARPVDTAESIVATIYDATIDNLERQLAEPGARRALALFAADLALGPELGR